MKRINKRIAIILILFLVLNMIGAVSKNTSILSLSKQKKPKLSKSSIVLKEDDQKTIRIQNVSANNIKKTTVSIEKKSIVSGWAETKNEIVIEHNRRFGKTVVLVKIKLNKKISGKKTYTLKLKVLVLNPEDESINLPSPTITPSQATQTATPTPSQTPNLTSPSPSGIPTSTPTKTPERSSSPTPTHTPVISSTPTVSPSVPETPSNKGEMKAGLYTIYGFFVTC